MMKGMTRGRLEEAVAYAAAVHAGELRKRAQGDPPDSPAVPYLAHLLAVAALVLEGGGDETAAVAALLHDAVEDGGGEARLAEIRARFGEQVAAIVEDCSDSLAADPAKKLPWWTRKRAYIHALPDKPAASLLVSLADKLHNARAILLDLHTPGIGERVWRRFKPESDQLWYYRELVEAFARSAVKDHRLLAELRRVVDEIELVSPPLRHPFGRAYRVWPDRLWAGAYPGAKAGAEPDAAAKLAALQAVGVTLIVDLTEHDEGLEPYAHLLDAGIRHVRLAVRDVSIPSQEGMRAILVEIRSELAGGGGVYLHCWGGHGRTGTAVGCWLVERGLEPDVALDLIAHWRSTGDDRHEPSPQTPEQRAFVRRWRAAA